MRGKPGRLDLACRRDGGRTTFEASAAPVTYELRLRDHAAPGGVTADGQVLPRLDGAAWTGADRGWTMDQGVVVVRARTRQIRVQ